MTEEIFTTAGHLSVAMTTAEIHEVQTTREDIMHSSNDLVFFFECAVVIVGITGMAANALILYAMVASKQHKKQLLVYNQNICSSLIIVIIYTLKLCNIFLTGILGY